MWTITSLVERFVPGDDCDPGSLRVFESIINSNTSFQDRQSIAYLVVRHSGYWVSQGAVYSVYSLIAS